MVNICLPAICCLRLNEGLGCIATDMAKRIPRGGGVGRSGSLAVIKVCTAWHRTGHVKKGKRGLRLINCWRFLFRFSFFFFGSTLLIFDSFPCKVVSLFSCFHFVVSFLHFAMVVRGVQYFTHLGRLETDGPGKTDGSLFWMTALGSV